MFMFEVDLISAASQDVIGPLMTFLIVICMNDESIKKDHHLKDKFLIEYKSIAIPNNPTSKKSNNRSRFVIIVQNT